MSPPDLQALPSRAPDRHIAYGEDSSQYGELRVPTGPGPHPVVVLVHGGCFKAAYDTVITSLLGGTPAEVPDHYAQTSAITLLPLGLPQVLVWGEHEEFVPRPLAEAYARAASQRGDPVRLIVIAGAGHFEIASPLAASWPRVASAVRSLLEGRLPP